MGHVDGSLPAPPQIVNGQPNPAYWSWYVRDQYVLTWINLSLSKAVLPNVVNKATALDACSALATIYASGSPVVIGQLRKDLFRLSRGNETIHEYLHRAKAIYDKMLALGATVTEQELVIALLDGLDEDYRPFTRNLEVRLELITFENVSSLLLSEEMQLQRFRSASAALSSPQSFYSDRGGGTAAVSHAVEAANLGVGGHSPSTVFLTLLLQVDGPIKVAQGLSHLGCWVLGLQAVHLCSVTIAGGRDMYEPIVQAPLFMPNPIITRPILISCPILSPGPVIPTVAP
ncbi:unnamed protein product [Linum trigynum]|uniref:Uncharacterized protein n=1 Tax=Linum trigynum TaxID=586398 RepID=A0AAV2DEX3_9ROSI